MSEKIKGSGEVTTAGLKEEGKDKEQSRGRGERNDGAVQCQTSFAAKIKMLFMLLVGENLMFKQRRVNDALDPERKEKKKKKTDFTN